MQVRLLSEYKVCFSDYTNTTTEIHLCGCRNSIYRFLWCVCWRLTDRSNFVSRNDHRRRRSSAHKFACGRAVDSASDFSCPRPNREKSSDSSRSWENGHVWPPCGPLVGTVCAVWQDIRRTGIFRAGEERTNAFGTVPETCPPDSDRWHSKPCHCRRECIVHWLSRCLCFHHHHRPSTGQHSIRPSPAPPSVHPILRPRHRPKSYPPSRRSRSNCLYREKEY